MTAGALCWASCVRVPRPEKLFLMDFTGVFAYLIAMS